MDHGEGPPLKRQRVLACRRCRGRKQKCEDRRPCSNCAKAGEDCVPTEPAPRPQVEGDYVRALEERIAELESRDPNQSRDHYARARTPQAARALAPPSLQGIVSGTNTGLPARRAQPTSSVSPATNLHNGLLHPRKSLSQQPPDLSLADDSDAEGIDHLLYGLASPPGRDNFGGGAGNIKSPSMHTGSVRHHDDHHYPAQNLVASMTPEVEGLLLGAYRGRAQVQYPFFHWPTLLDWVADWRTCPPAELNPKPWQGFFVNLVFATALLMLALPRVGQSDSRVFYKHGVALLPHVLRRNDPIMHVQAYLLLSMHALHRSNTPRILSLASTTMRMCVQLQYHLAETELEPTTPAALLQNQVRRRCFWSAYCVDRLVMASFELPPSITDAMITSKLYANVEDEDLESAVAQLPAGADLGDVPVYTCVSPSLHILQCRRIQSEIINYTLRWDYKEVFEGSLEWRIRILRELENYKARAQNFAEPQSKGHSSQRWLALIYHYTLLLLYRPTKDNVYGPAGDWAIQASSQACLMFRRSQMDRQIAQAWIGLLVQFQSGVTLLYCCWATPMEYRTDNYDAPDVSDALRACSNILAIMADRWPKAESLRDVFELLAREIPLVDRPSRPPTRITPATADAIRAKLVPVRSLIVHRSIIRMIEEMINEDFPRRRPNQSPSPSVLARSQRATPARDRQIVPPSMADPTMAPFELPLFAQQLYGTGTGSGSGEMEAPINTDELLAFPGFFDLDGWQ
ncbi:uncharacterized protein J7T54_006281 [Emericellopsis cladophorae]|uniref:Zn(2)-C6 fungal-type domain-containing protein n=1 Tax=Emericellopsis cladophorae TaxID=2686198 RepID=A0A9Q0BHD2_9HYPO|nr:uncharacterized protein J7T54_006281 [Emericellopsis cladophorae]KAI6785942.1 hypothetical protein J7T54_006281 [Emericellopsis cladophorae]